MPKRFGETDIWKKQRWFRKMSAEDKLVFFYIKDLCNHAGILNIDCADLLEDTGLENFDIEKFIKSCNTEFDKTTGKEDHKERVRLVGNNKLWITGFIQFQYEGKEGKINQFAGPVKTALQVLSGMGLLEESIEKNYISLAEPLQDPHVRAKDKDKEKNKDVLTSEELNTKNAREKKNEQAFKKFSPDDAELKKEYKKIELPSDAKEAWVIVKQFITDKKPLFADPFVDAWNIFSSWYKFPAIQAINDQRRKHFSIRIREPGFDFIKILDKAKHSDFLKTGDFFSFDWLIKNDSNYLKVLEGNYK